MIKISEKFDYFTYKKDPRSNHWSLAFLHDKITNVELFFNDQILALRGCQRVLSLCLLLLLLLTDLDFVFAPVTISEPRLSVQKSKKIFN